MTANKSVEDSEKVKIKKKFPKFRKNLHDYFSEYSGNTGIHGFKYMGEQDRTFIEKLWWFILFCISLYICITLIIQTWIKWDTSPVLVSFARSPTPIWQVPFPAITICPETKAKQRLYNFTKTYNQIRIRNGINVTEEELKNFTSTSVICDDHLNIDGREFIDYGSIDFIKNVSPQLFEVFMSCKWTLINTTCDNLFSPVMTEDGLCFTFNMLDRSEIYKENAYFHDDMSHYKKSEGWTLEHGYPQTAEKDTFPKRAMSSGTSAGLFLFLRLHKEDVDYICRGPVQGFKVLLHHPAEVPRISTQYFRLPINQEVIVSVKPDMMTTSDGLKDYEPHRRQCYFPNERDLFYFQNYTQENCQIECFANYSLSRCDCVPFYMPHQKSTKLCGPGSFTCLHFARNEYLSNEVQKGIHNTETYEKDDTIKDCDCLPSCVSLTYSAETSQTGYDWEKLLQSFEAADPNEDPGRQFSRLVIFFKEMQFITSERNELFGQTDFLANCGGLLGLFTGFSFLSIVEIVYYLSLRLMCNIKMYGRHYWSGSSNLINNPKYYHSKN